MRWRWQWEYSFKFVDNCTNVVRYNWCAPILRANRPNRLARILL
jgi:hypothetical protein